METTPPLHFHVTIMHNSMLEKISIKSSLWLGKWFAALVTVFLWCLQGEDGAPGVPGIFVKVGPFWTWMDHISFVNNLLSLSCSVGFRHYIKWIPCHNNWCTKLSKLKKIPLKPHHFHLRTNGSSSSWTGTLSTKDMRIIFAASGKQVNA